MTQIFTMRSLIGVAAIVAALASATAVSADDDNDENNDFDDSVQMIPFGFGRSGGMNMMARPIDSDFNGIVSASEASQHASIGFSLFDIDEDGKISRDEYLESAPWVMPMGRRNVERLFVNRTARFVAMDANADDDVTLAEFMAAAQSSYESADANGDGTVTVWEFRAQRNPF